MHEKIYEYDAIIQSSDIGKGGAYVVFPGDMVCVTVREKW